MKENRSYISRISDQELKNKLNACGALLIRGMKACGKTESAKQFANSMISFDQDEQVSILMQTAPQRLLLGETPRLIDEWQEYPKIWSYVRHEVDNRNDIAQFILTGSANPEETIKMHSGAGRFTTLDMRTLSWQELGYSSGDVRLRDLFDSKSISVIDEPLSLEKIVERIVIGGFPSLINKTIVQAREVNQAYVNLVAEVDMSRVSKVKRNPSRVRSLLRSYARNSATLVDVTTLAADIKEKENIDLSRPTIYDYLDALERLMIIENQPAWNTHIRSSSSLRKAPKRHLTDVALAVAVLGIDEELLLKDVKFTGFLFESMGVHDLRVYAQANKAEVFHYNDSSGLEVDAIVQKQNGDWCAFEIKLGIGQIEEAALNLLKFASIIDDKKTTKPKSLNIITGTGISYTRPDGINVISMGSLGY
jgi:predicted AAA+ superfamily ATPase